MDENEVEATSADVGAADVGGDVGGGAAASSVGATDSGAETSAPASDPQYSLPDWDVAAWDGEDESVPEILRTMVTSLRGRFGLTEDQKSQLSTLEDLRGQVTGFEQQRAKWGTERDELNKSLTESRESLAQQLAVVAAIDSGIDDPRIADLQAQVAELNSTSSNYAKRIAAYEQAEVQARRSEAESMFNQWAEAYPSVVGRKVDLGDNKYRYEGGHDEAYALAGQLTESGVPHMDAMKLAAQHFGLRAEPTISPAAAAINGSQGRPGGGVADSGSTATEMLESALDRFFARKRA